MQPRNNRIFISYRRSTSAPWAGRLFDALRQVIPPDRVFLDVTSIPLGTDFNVSIDDFLSSCAVTLVLIDHNWLDVRDHRGIRRLELLDDPVRKEIGSALRNSDWTIPVLIDGAPMPRSDQLPEDIAHLTHKNALTLSHDSFYRDFDYLRHVLWEFLGDLISDPTHAALGFKLHQPRIIGAVAGFAVNTAPLPPDYYVPTQQASAEVKRHLQGALRSGNPFSLLFLGQGGIGKSTFAQALCHDSEISSSFTDGIFWVPVGTTTRLDAAIELACNAFFPRPLQVSSAQAFLSLFVSRLRQKRALLVLDDVWEQYTDPSFELLRTSINVLITTRLENVAQRLGVQPLRVEPMGQAQAITLLQRASVSETALEPRPSNVLVNLLDRLPLAITIAARLITDNNSLRTLTTRLATEVNRVSFLEKTAEDLVEDPSARYRSVYASINVSLELLTPGTRNRFAELAVLKMGQGLSVGCTATVWGCDIVTAQRHIVELSYVSLLKRRYDMGTVAMYDMHHLVHNCATHLVSSETPPAGLKSKLNLKGWWRGRRSPATGGYIDAQRRLVDRLRSTLDSGKWATLDQDPYFVRNLFWHFREAESNSEVFSTLREELIDVRSRSIKPARLNALERVNAAHQYSTDVEIAWDVARVQLDKSRTPNAVADAVLCKALRIYVSATQFGNSGESIWLMREFGFWTDAEAASWARGLSDPLEIAAIAASLNSELAFDLLQYCARRLRDRGISPIGPSGHLEPSWQWLLEVAIFHGMDGAGLLVAQRSIGAAPTGARFKVTPYENMALALELLPPFVVPAFCKVICSNFVASQNKGEEASLLKLGFALELASMICGDGEPTMSIRQELSDAIRSQTPPGNAQLDSLQNLFRNGICTVVPEICLLDQELGYRLALDLTDEKERNPWPAAFISRRPTEGFASASDAFFVGSQHPRLDFKVNIFLTSFANDPRRAIALCLGAIEARSRDLDKRITIPERAAFSLTLCAARGARPAQVFLSEFRSARHQFFVRFLEVVAHASADGLSDYVRHDLQEELRTALTSDWVFAYVALSKVHGEKAKEALSFDEFAARRDQVSVLRALHSSWDAAPAWLRLYWLTWLRGIVPVADEAKFLRSILRLRTVDLASEFSTEYVQNGRECCRILNDTASRPDRLRYLNLAHVCRSLRNADKRSMAASACGIGVPDVDEDTIARAFAKSVSLMKGPARELLLVQAPVLHRFRAVRLSTDDRKKCVHWQAQLSGTTLLIGPTGAEPLENPANPALAKSAKPLAPNKCFVEQDKWFRLAETDCLEQFVDWLLKFDAYADWKLFFETSSEVSRALVFRSENSFQKALLQETLRLARWLL